jgi:hypothetical protein
MSNYEPPKGPIADWKPSVEEARAYIAQWKGRSLRKLDRRRAPRVRRRLEIAQEVLLQNEARAERVRERLAGVDAALDRSDGHLQEAREALERMPSHQASIRASIQRLRDIKL